MRPDSLSFLFSPVTRIKGVGSAVAKTLSNLLPPATAVAGSGLPIIRDLLFHLPVSIVDRRFTCGLSEAPADVVATFVVTVDEHIPPKQKRYGKQPYKVTCSNDTGSITLVFFHARNEYLKSALPVGGKRVISGRTEHFEFALQMTHPDIIAPLSDLEKVQKPEPVYPLTMGMTSRRIATMIEEIISKLPDFEEWIDADIIKKYNWPSFKQALKIAHHPQSEEDLNPQLPARMRLAYDEMLAGQLHMAMLRQQMHKQAGKVIKGDGSLTKPLIESLPFKLTKGQLQVDKEIAADISAGGRMTRLLQGDVGSGKTIVALLSMLRAAEHGVQSALMVPTELIARQHYETISSLFSGITPSPLEGEGWGEGYKKSTLHNAKKLRSNQTDVEKKLWQLLRSRQLENYKFRRQQPIGKYIVDFYCSESGLIVELDGGQHGEQVGYDNERTEFLERQGYRVLHFWNNEVVENLEGVYQAIMNALEKTPHPSPLPQGERGLDVALLTGSIKGKERKEVLGSIASGDAKIIIGTHALFQEKVEFKNLSFLVVDEQHRFGVNQRMALSSKGDNPHILHMTATPIPRSLTMTMYGDMDISQLSEKPAERLPITTRTIPAERYDDVVARLKAALDRGEKAYWICPLIEDKPADDADGYTTDSDIAAVKSRFTEFKQRFGNVVGLVHGKMKKDECAEQMQQFSQGKLKLLVATTVVEVGVDVRDATIMVIEQAERFGLSQLHQLRGRVGRGDKQSSCVLLYSSKSAQIIGDEADASDTQERLAILRDSEDGFEIAEADLNIRGGGDLLGTRQSGMARFIFTNLYEHRQLLEEARNDAANILENNNDIQDDSSKFSLLLYLFGKK